MFIFCQSQRCRRILNDKMASETLINLGLPRAAIHPRDLPRATIPGLYLHVPFCFHKCHYCDFYSITHQSPERMERFVDLILREADHWTRPPVTLRPRTVFFGGGTPTLLPMETMARLLVGLRDRFDFSDVHEWTIEANP